MSENLPATIDKEHALAMFRGDSNAFTDDANEHGVSDAMRLGFNGNTGDWKAGTKPAAHGDQFIFLMTEAARGWIAWKNNKPVEQIWAKIMDREALPNEDELPDHWDGKPKGERAKETDGWSYTVKVPVRDLDGNPSMEVTLPGAPSYRPINKLLKAFGGEAKYHIDPDTGRWMYPLVEIGAESFDSKGGKKFAPTLKIVDWMTEAELTKLESEFIAASDVKGPDKDTATALKPAAAPPAAGYRRQRVGG